LGKEFNVTGTCIPGMHYMVDTINKLNSIMKLIEKGRYFTINRPRQYGKTTTLYMLSRTLEHNDYLSLRISFEGIDAPTYEKHESFIKAFLDIIREKLEFLNEDILAKLLDDQINDTKTMRDLSKLITRFVKCSGRKVVLMIDEVDKSSNNQLFLDFLGMLREKYLLKNTGEDYTFYSVILAGVHDVKSLKMKIRPDVEQKYNSPWNDHPTIQLGEMYGVFREENNKIKIHNRIYEQRIYNYMSSKVELSTNMGGYNFRGNFIEKGGHLNFEMILLKFQEFMKQGILSYLTPERPGKRNGSRIGQLWMARRFLWCGCKQYNKIF